MANSQAMLGSKDRKYCWDWKEANAQAMQKLIALLLRGWLLRFIIIIARCVCVVVVLFLLLCCVIACKSAEVEVLRYCTNRVPFLRST
jgi:hypothetical protein